MADLENSKDLISVLWSGADILRSKMDANEYKDYLLGMYAATHYRDGVIPNESAIKATIDFTSYKEAQEKALPKFKFYTQMMAELRKTLDEEIKPLLIH